MSSTARILARSGFQAARRVTSPIQTSRILGRRSYATAHDIKKTSDLPWILMASGITIPGVYFLWPSKSSHGDHSAHGAEHTKHEDHDEHADDSDSKEEQSTTSNDTSSESGGGNNMPSPKPKGSDGGDSEGHDQSTENQSQKLTDKPASKRVDPTEK